MDTECVLAIEAGGTKCEALLMTVDGAALGFHAVYPAAIGHSNEQDFLNRAGGPAFLQPLAFSLSLNDPVADCLKDRPPAEPFDRECELVRLALRAGNLRPGDLVAVGSVSGRNVRPVAIALTCRELGIRTIAFTSMPYTVQVDSAHPSGRKLAEVADVTIDNGAPYGDAAVEIPGCPQKIGPLSTLTGVAIVNALVAETVARLVAAHVVPPVFMSANVDGGDAHNAAQLKANAHRIHYMN